MIPKQCQWCLIIYFSSKTNFKNKFKLLVTVTGEKNQQFSTPGEK
jgi:hypothetical protein